jgi:hypothetical protein
MTRTAARPGCAVVAATRSRMISRSSYTLIVAGVEHQVRQFCQRREQVLLVADRVGQRAIAGLVRRVRDGGGGYRDSAARAPAFDACRNTSWHLHAARTQILQQFARHRQVLRGAAGSPGRWRGARTSDRRSSISSPTTSDSRRAGTLSSVYHSRSSSMASATLLPEPDRPLTTTSSIARACADSRRGCAQRDWLLTSRSYSARLDVVRRNSAASELAVCERGGDQRESLRDGKPTSSSGHRHQQTEDQVHRLPIRHVEVHRTQQSGETRRPAASISSMPAVRDGDAILDAPCSRAFRG